MLIRYYASFDVLQYVVYLFFQVTPCQSFLINFIVVVVIANISKGLHQQLQIIYNVVLKSISIFCSNCNKIDVCAITCSKIFSAMKNLLEVIAEYNEIALRRNSVGFSGMSLSSNNTCHTGSYNSETANTAECFSVK